jgi:hypothetical protein
MWEVDGNVEEEEKEEGEAVDNTFIRPHPRVRVSPPMDPRKQ